MNLIFYIVAIVLFLVAAFNGGIDTGWQDMTAFGLAAFAAAHIVPPANWPARTQA